MKCLAADIGGTYSRFAWIEPAVGKAARVVEFRNADFDSLEGVIDKALSGFGQSGSRIDHMALAVPGPVHTDPVHLTNIDWQFGRMALQARFNIDHLTVINDFQAAAMGAVQQPFERMKVLNAATPNEGPRVVAGAGTGLGMAWFSDGSLDRLPQATEGGHLDFAPNDESEVALYLYLAGRYGHVSYERILSGDGLLDVYRHLAGQSAPCQTPAEIVARAHERDKHAEAAVTQFVDVFAAYTGNLALAFTPRGGIYLCGGMVVHLEDWFEPTAFVSRFAAKGRMSDLVRTMPVFLVTRHDTGLTGAINIAKKHHKAET